MKTSKAVKFPFQFKQKSLFILSFLPKQEPYDSYRNSKIIFKLLFLSFGLAQVNLRKEYHYYLQKYTNLFKTEKPLFVKF